MPESHDMRYEYPLQVYCNDQVRAFLFGTNRLTFNMNQSVSIPENKSSAQEILDWACEA